jgi:8-oxo-dGTP pyrophosphatase MutT (NUDIX family)
MRREFSAGGVVVRRDEGVDWVAVIRPQGKPAGHWVLPKGALDAGESAEVAALREVQEETGLTASTIAKLGSVRYVYTWAGERIFKVVTFFLMRYEDGEIGAIEEAMRVEVHEATWLRLDEAPRLLAHKGEQEMAAKAAALIGGDAEL